MLKVLLFFIYSVYSRKRFYEYTETIYTQPMFDLSKIPQSFMKIGNLDVAVYDDQTCKFQGIESKCQINQPIVAGLMQVSIFDIILNKINIPNQIKKILDQQIFIDYELNTITQQQNFKGEISLNYMKVSKNLQFNQILIELNQDDKESFMKIQFNLKQTDQLIQQTAWDSKQGFKVQIPLIKTQFSVGQKNFEFRIDDCSLTNIQENYSIDCSNYPQIYFNLEYNMIQFLNLVENNDFKYDQRLNKMSNFQILYNFDDQKINIVNDDENYLINVFGFNNKLHSVIKEQNQQIQIFNFLAESQIKSIKIGNFEISMNILGDGQCTIVSEILPEMNIDCTQYPIVQLSFQGTLENLLKKINITDIPDSLKKILEIQEKVRMNLNFETSSYDISAGFLVNEVISDYQLINQIQLQDLDINIKGIGSNFTTKLEIKSKINQTQCQIEWDGNDNKFDLKIDKINMRELWNNILRNQIDDSNIMQDFLDFQILNINFELQNFTKIKFSAEFSFNSSLLFQAEYQKGLLIDFEKLENIHYAQINSQLSFIDDFFMKLSKFKLSTYKETQGIEIKGIIPFDNKIMLRIHDFFKMEDKTELDFDIKVESLKKISIEIMLQGQISYQNWKLDSSSLVFLYQGSEFKAQIKTVMEINLQETFQKFKGIMQLTETEFSLQAQLISDWQKPFGFTNSAIHKAGIKLGITEIPPYFNIALQGNFTLVESEFEFDFAFSPNNPAENLFDVQVDNLNFTTLVKGTSDAKIPQSVKKFTDNFLLKEGLICVAPPTGVELFDQKFPGGVSGKINLDVFNFNMLIDICVQTDIIKFKGNCDKIETQYLKLSSFEDDSKGPSVDILVGGSDLFHLNLDAKLYLFNITTRVIIYMDPQGLNLKAKEYFYPFGLKIFEFELYSLLTKGEKIDFVKLEFEANFTGYNKDLQQAFHKYILLASQKSIEPFYEAQDKLAQAIQNLEKEQEIFDQRILQAEINYIYQVQVLEQKYNQQIQQAIYVLDKARNDANQKFDDAQVQANQQLEEALRKCPRWLRWICRPTIKVAENICQTSIEMARFVTNSQIKSAELIYEKSIQAIQETEVLEKQAALTAKVAAYQLAQDGLKVAQAQVQFSQKVVESSRIVYQQTLKLIDQISQNMPFLLDDMYFKISSESLDFKLILQARIYNKPVIFNYQTNIKQNLIDLLQKLGEIIFSDIKQENDEQVKQTLFMQSTKINNDILALPQSK